MTNSFQILGIVGKEDPVSDLLAAALEASPGFRRGFFEEFLGVEDRPVATSTRSRMGDSGLPDLVVASEAPSGDVFLFENKLKAEEGRDQTSRYASDEVVRLLAERFKRGSGFKPKYFFLTLYPDQEPGSDRFISRRYQDLIPILRSYQKGETPAVDTLLQDLCALLESFYERAMLDDSDLVTDVLQEKTTADLIGGGYLAFKTLMGGLKLPDGVDIGGYFRLSARGRQAYGVLISRQAWAPEQMTDAAAFDPRSNYSVHFEPQYNLLTKRLEMALHFEVNPYRTRAWCETHLSEGSLTAFESMRAEFKRHLRESNVPRLKVRNYWLQVGKADFAVEGLTVREAASQFSDFVLSATPAIDSALSICLDT